MQLLIESTAAVVTIDGVQCRVWSGCTAGGLACEVYVCRVGADDPYAQEELARELREMPPPREHDALALAAAARAVLEWFGHGEGGVPPDQMLGRLRAALEGG